MLRAAITICLLLTASPALSATASPPPTAIDLWNAMLKDAMALFQQGQFAKALPIVNATIVSMEANLGRGEGAHHALALALTYRAVAYEGIHLRDEALWYWSVAQNLYPRLAEMDLSSFCEPGEVLKAHPLRTEALPVVPAELLPFLLPPTELSRVKPKFPRGALGFDVVGDVVVEVLITPSGSVSSPRIVSTLPAPTMAYAALEAVKYWCYSPATLHGEPVSMPLTVTVTFKRAR